jgi:hypothetical protein
MHLIDAQEVVMAKINHWLRTSPFSLALLLPVILITGIASGTAGAVTLQNIQSINSVPTMMSYQGRVFVDGQAFHGTGSFKFAVTDVDSGDGNNCWANDGTASGEPVAAVPLEVTYGLFDVLLGDTSLSGMSQPLTEAVFQNDPTYLRVWFSHTGEGGSYQALEPNQRIVSAPYALHAEVAQTAGESDTVDGYHAGSAPAADQLISLDSASHLNVPRVNDSDMAGYYLDPWGTSVFDHLDLRGNLFNQNSNYVTVVDNIHADRFVDREFTGFYTDPGTVSILQDIDLRGTLFNDATNSVTVADDIHATAFVDLDDPYNYWVNPTGISIFNNVYWTGHLQGIEVSSSYFAQSLSDGYVSTTMVPAENSICFLVETEYAELDYMTEISGCSVYISGDHWVLEAYASDNPTDFCYAACRGQCILW